MNKILKLWLLTKALGIIAVLAYNAFLFKYMGLRDEGTELIIIEYALCSITSLMLLVFFHRMYENMKYIVIFDFIFLVFIGYQFHLDYILLFVDLITIGLIVLDNRDVQNFVKRKLRKMNIEIKSKSHI